MSNLAKKGVNTLSIIMIILDLFVGATTIAVNVKQLKEKKAQKKTML